MKAIAEIMVRAGWQDSKMGARMRKADLERMV